jgi:hypothetical protein
MRASVFSTTSKEIVRWSEPLVADHIYNEYERLLGGRSDASESLGRQHCRMWRHLLDSEAQRAHVARRDLVNLARLARINPAEIEAMDAAIFDELLNVILRRGLSSRDSARLDGMVLVRAASTLGEIRQAA